MSGAGAAPARRPAGIALAGAPGTLVRRTRRPGASRLTPYRMPSRMTHPADEPTRPTAPASPDEQIDEAVEESFPASDPPSFSPLHSGTPQPPEPPHGATSPDAPPEHAS